MLDFPRPYCKPFACFAENGRGGMGGSARSAAKAAPLSAEAQRALLFAHLTAGRSARSQKPRASMKKRGAKTACGEETRSQVRAEKGRGRRRQKSAASFQKSTARKGPRRDCPSPFHLLLCHDTHAVRRERCACPLHFLYKKRLPKQTLVLLFHRILCFFSVGPMAR